MDSIISFVLLYLLAGAIAGFLAGLLGIGGGIILVPVFIFAFELQSFDPSVLTHMAIATSLACILFTSMSSSWVHYQNSDIERSTLYRLGVGLCIGSALGVVTILQLDGEWLKRLIGIFAILMAVRMALAVETKQRAVVTQSHYLGVSGAFIGWASALFGIGGGALTVPLMSYQGWPIKSAISMGAMCGFPIALVASLQNTLMGLTIEGRPDYSLGLIYLPALASVIITSMIFARFGAHTSHSVSSNLLKRGFAVLLLIVGFKLVQS